MKKTRKSLVLSIVTLLLCSCMFIGSTLAWFTDSVSNTGNKIQAGTLDIDLLQRYDTMSDEQKATFAEAPHDREFVSLDTDALRTIGVFDYDKWEPGYTEYKVLQVKNNGNLALKFYLQFVAEEEVKTPARLADAIDVYTMIVPAGTSPVSDPASLNDVASWTKTTLSELIDDPDGGVHGYILPYENGAIGRPTYYTCHIVMHMREDAGNEYQNLSVGSKLDINLRATQYTYEEDGFDSKLYDEKAYLYGSEVAALLKDNGAGKVTEITLANDVVLSEAIKINDGAKIIIHGNGFDIKFKGKVLSAGNDSVDSADILIDGVDFVGSGYSGNYAISTARNCGVNITIENSTFSNMLCGLYIDDSSDVSQTITLKNNDFSGALWNYSLGNNTTTNKAVTSTSNVNGILGEKELFGDDKKSAQKVSNVSQLESAIENAVDGSKIFVMPGTYNITKNEALRMDVANVKLIGADANTTIIDAGEYVCSTQGALLIAADGIEVSNLTVKTNSNEGSVAAIKVTNLDSEYTTKILENIKIENVILYGNKGHGLNVHGADKVTINNVDIRSFGKCGIAFAKATNVTINNTKVAVGGWGCDIGFMYGSGDAYNLPSNVTIGNDNVFNNGKIYSERPSAAAGGVDTISGLDSSWNRVDDPSGSGTWAYTK